MKKAFLLLFIIVFLIAGPASAQQASPSSTPTQSPSAQASPSTTPTETSSPTLESSAAPVTNASSFNFWTRSIVLTRLRRFFTRDQQKRTELTAAITNALIIRAQTLAENGNAAGADSVLNSFDREMQLLSTLVQTISTNTTNQTTLTFLDKILEDKSTQLTGLEGLQPHVASELSRKIISIRAKALKDIVRILVNSKLSPEEQEKKLAKVIENYTRHEARIDRKIAKRLELMGDMDDETDDDEFGVELEKEEDKALTDAAALDQDKLNRLTLALEDENEKVERSLVLLEKLLSLVSAEAKPSVEVALAAIIQRRVLELNRDPQIIASFAKQLEIASDSQEITKKILERLMKATEKADEATKKEVEKQVEATKKKAEEQKKTLEETKKKSGSSGSSTESRSSESGETKTTPSPSTEQRTVEIKIKEGAITSSSYSAEKGSDLIIRLKNEDDTSFTFTTSNGLSAIVSPDSERQLSSFRFDTPVTFTITVGGKTITGTISIK